MKAVRNVVIGIGALSILACTGCSSWIKQIESNPALFAQQVEADTNIVVEGLSLAFNTVIPLLPADQQAVWKTKFTASVVALNDAEAALNSIISVAQKVGNTNPDITGVITDIVKAVTSIEDIVMQVKTLVGSSPAPAPSASSSVASAKLELQSNLDKFRVVYKEKYARYAKY